VNVQTFLDEVFQQQWFTHDLQTNLTKDFLEFYSLPNPMRIEFCLIEKLSFNFMLLLQSNTSLQLSKREKSMQKFCINGLKVSAINAVLSCYLLKSLKRSCSHYHSSS
jgi:hypothetical protein